MPRFTIVANREDIPPLGSGWREAEKFDSKGVIVDGQGNYVDISSYVTSRYRLVAKRERNLSYLELSIISYVESLFSTSYIRL